MLIGTLLSPYIFDGINYYGCYGLAITLAGLMSAYCIFLVKEAPNPNEPLKLSPGKSRNLSPPYKPKSSINYDTNSEYTNDEYIDQSCCYNFYNLIVLMATSCLDMFKVLFTKRKGNLQFIVILIITIYALFWFAVEEMLMQYNYLLEAFPGFDGDLYSIFTSVNYVCSKYHII